jgi:hypothetical protein
MDYELIEPTAASLAESLRAFGYNLESAIADLIDNSISAGSKNIWVDFFWDGENSSIGISDDGVGMTEEELRDAMRVGSQNPNTPRGDSDLGRFGMGMKTASFSQCRCVTVSSKRENSDVEIKRWDLDHLALTNAWQVLLEAKGTSGRHLKRLDRVASGTCVLWQTLDQISGTSGTEKNREIFYGQCEKVEKHLALTFHRIIQKKNNANIFINERAVVPDDPFFLHEATQILQEQIVSDSTGSRIFIEPFVMPHESKLADVNSKSKAGDSRDWCSKQGFYVYRQDRLLVAATWFDFRGWRKDEFHKLARVRVSLTNSSDREWKLDVTKQKATPPDSLRESLRRVGRMTRERAKRVYSFRGSRTTSRTATEKEFVWEQIDKHGEMSFLINRKHPMIASLLDSSEPNGGKELASVLKLIENTIPIRLIGFAQKEEETAPGMVSEQRSTEEVGVMLRQACHSLREQGFEHAKAVELLSKWEPFDEFPALIAHLESNPTLP